jgi:methylamine utilization protein MauE
MCGRDATPNKMEGIDPAIGYLLSIALALIFGASAILKLSDLELFAGSVANYQLLPRWMEKPFAYALAMVECAAAAGVLFAVSRAAAAETLALLLVLFSAAIAINLIRGRADFDCGCFGPALRQQLSGWLLVRNLFLMMMASMAVLPIGVRSIEWLDAVTIGVGAGTLVTLYAGANYALGNIPATRALRMLR